MTVTNHFDSRTKIFVEQNETWHIANIGQANRLHANDIRQRYTDEARHCTEGWHDWSSSINSISSRPTARMALNKNAALLFHVVSYWTDWKYLFDVKYHKWIRFWADNYRNKVVVGVFSEQSFFRRPHCAAWKLLHCHVTVPIWRWCWWCQT